MKLNTVLLAVCVAILLITMWMCRREFIVRPSRAHPVRPARAPPQNEERTPRIEGLEFAIELEQVEAVMAYLQNINNEVTMRAAARAAMVTGDDEVLAAINAIAREDDPENVHDRQLNADFARAIGELRRTWTSRADWGDLRARSTRPGDFDLVVKVMFDGEKDHYVLAYGDTDVNIVDMVWSRSAIPENVGSADAILDALAESISDCVEDGEVVCVHGRCARIIASLAHLDWTGWLGLGRTVASMKQELYAEVGRALRVGERTPETVNRTVEGWIGTLGPAEVEEVRANCITALDV